MHRYVTLVAIFALIVIATGAFVTSAKGAGNVHLGLAIALGVLTLALVVWLSLTKALRSLAWIALVILVLDGLTSNVAVAHACLAPLFFSAMVALALFTSPGWKQNAETVDDRGWSSLRLLAIAAPPLVLGQIALGAAYRHKLTGVMPHMAGALIVSLLTLIVSMVVMQQYPEHQPLRRAAITLMSVVLTQVTFGVAAFTLQLLDMESSQASVLATVLHVVTGSATLSGSMLLAIQVHRHVRAKVISEARVD
jgi:cytochrome c oxidase assembly protein subunit 15